MRKYSVTWIIDIEADTPKEAAEHALEIQRRPYSIATVFNVIDKDTRRTYVIDLDPEEGDGIPCKLKEVQ